MSIKRGILAIVMAAIATMATAQAGKPSALDQRIMAKLQADPALAAGIGRPAAQMAKLAPFVGSWEVKTARADQGLGTSTITPAFNGIWLEIRGAFPGGIQYVGFLGFNPGIGKWQSISIDNFGNANILQADDWDGDRLVFEGDVMALGVAAHVRQVMTKVNNDEFRIASEERVDGVWQPMYQHHYRRERP